MNTKKLVRVRPKYGTSKRLAKAFGVTPEFFSVACAGKSNTELARKIRMAALNAGGDPIYESI